MITRDAPTKDAQMNIAVYAPPKVMMVIVEKQKAADVWPDGKLNLSDAVMRVLRFFLKSHGRRRLNVFFVM